MTDITVLVVDDDRDLRESVSDSLEFSGYQVMQAADGSDALLIASQLLPGSVVYSDTNMPGLDGIGLCRALRETYGNKLGIIGTSAGDFYNGMPVERAWKEAGADAFLRCTGSDKYIVRTISSVAEKIKA